MQKYHSFILGFSCFKPFSLFFIIINLCCTVENIICFQSIEKPSKGGETKKKEKQRSFSSNDQPERPLSRGGSLREQENVCKVLIFS